VRSHPKYFFLAFLVVAPGMATSCFSDYAGDCDRNVDLGCFWDGAGAASGTGTGTLSCGDGALDAGEACDDGNTVDCDGCRGDCSAVETGCGDGLTCNEEQCDDGPQNGDPGACSKECMQAGCGDGLVQDGEECDDQNTLEDDGCFECKRECKVGSLPVGSMPEANTTVFKDIAASRCYVRVKSSQKSWIAARTACQTWGGDLVAWSTAAEYDTVAQELAIEKVAWTGGNDQATPGTFVWANGEAWPSSPVWAASQPDDGGPGGNSEACVELDSGGFLSDADCAALLPYICERELPAAPPTP